MVAEDFLVPLGGDGIDFVSWGKALKTFLFHLHDDRSPVPAVDTVTVSSENRALELARSRLASSSHHTALEIWEGERLVARLEGKVARPEI